MARVGIFTLNYRYSEEPIYALHKKIIKLQTGLDVQYGTQFDDLEKTTLYSDYWPVPDISNIPFVDLQGFVDALETTYLHAMNFQDVLSKNKDKYDYIVFLDMDCYFKRKDSLEYLISLTENKTVVGFKWSDELNPITAQQLDSNELYGQSLDHLKHFSREELLEVKHKPEWLHSPVMCIPTCLIDEYNLDDDDLSTKGYRFFSNEQPDAMIDPNDFYPSNLQNIIDKYLKERYLEEPYNEIRDLRDFDHPCDAAGMTSIRLRQNGVEPRFITDEEIEKYFVHCHGYSYIIDEYDYSKYSIPFIEYVNKRKKINGTKETFIENMSSFLEKLELLDAYEKYKNSQNGRALEESPLNPLYIWTPTLIRERVGIFTLNYRYSNSPLYEPHKNIMKKLTGYDVQYGTQYDHIDKDTLFNRESVDDNPFDFGHYMLQNEQLIKANETGEIHSEFVYNVLKHAKSAYEYIIIMDMDCYFTHTDSLNFLIEKTKNKTISGLTSWVKYPFFIDDPGYRKLFLEHLCFGDVTAIDHFKDITDDDLYASKHQKPFVLTSLMCIPTPLIDEYNLDNTEIIVKAGQCMDANVTMKYLRERYLEEPYNEISNVDDYEFKQDVGNVLTDIIRRYNVQPALINAEEQNKYFRHCKGYSYDLKNNLSSTDHKKEFIKTMQQWSDDLDAIQNGYKNDQSFGTIARQYLESL